MIVIIVGLILAFLAIFYKNELFWYLNSQKYMKQGIATRYYPVTGYMKFASSPGREDGDGLFNWRKIFQKKSDPNKTEPLILTNGVGSSPLLLINDEKLAKEWFIKREKFSLPVNLQNFPFQESFHYKETKVALSQRAIMTKLFLVDNLRKSSPALIQVLKRQLNDVKRKVLEKSKNGEFVEISLEQHFKQITAETIGYTLFGGETPTFEGQPINVPLGKVNTGTFFYMMTNFWHKVTGGLSTKLGFSKEYNEIDRIHQGCKKVLKKLVNDRTHSKDYQLGLNLVDIIIEHNKKVHAEGHPEKALSTEEIIDNIKVFIFAAAEASNAFYDTCVYLLGQYQDYQKELREEVRKAIFNGEATFDDYMESEYLDNFVTECFRVHGPVLSTFYEEVFKNFKLGDYKVYKGTGVLVSVYSMQKKPEYFENPIKFDLKKYENKRRIKELKRGLMVPFGGGNRFCIGQNLAKFSIKIAIANIVNMFEIKESSRINPRLAGVTCTVGHSSVKLRVLS